MTDIHAQIQSFLQQRNILALPAGTSQAPLEHEHYTKAGVIPFIRRGDELQFYVMKPVAKRLDKGTPPFQLCKGTRQFRAEGADWQDMRGRHTVSGEVELLIQTALREGIEELGLRLENILGIYDAHGYGFISEATGQARRMWLYALEVRDRDAFLPDADIAVATAERRWVSVEEFDIVGRTDHRYILPDIQERLIRLQE